MNAALRPTDRITLFVVVNNAFDKRYYTYGSFGPVGDVPWPNVPGGVTDPQTIYWDVTNLQLCNASSGTGIGTTIGPITNVTIDAIGVGNCRTVSYNGTTNFANWVETGSCVVLIV